MPTSHLQHVAALRLESERRLALVATTLLLVPGVLFAYVDISVVPNRTTLTVLHALRASQLLLWALGVAVIRKAESRAALGRVLFLLALAIVAFLTSNALLRPADNWMPVRTMVLVSIGTFVVYPYPFRLQLVAWAALLVSVTGLIWSHWVTMPSYERVATGLNIVLAGVLGMLIARNRTQLDKDLDASLAREQAAIEAREQAVAELRKLEGIIPICAYCHQVRTEAGAWEGLDRYVRAHSDADFSHGMCPRCAREHFPEYMETSAGPR
ncbi:MAG TPA: hypothetical protein VGJ96_01645 [Gemmatimonadaceae bacterium]|jgi:hypothetical protein